MTEIKKITKDGYILTHSWYCDYSGLKRNSFDLFHEESKIHYPFWGDIRVVNYNKGTAYGGDDISPYTDEQYLNMLDMQIKKLSMIKSMIK
jgi:hypothetical protein